MIGYCKGIKVSYLSANQGQPFCLNPRNLKKNKKSHVAMKSEAAAG